MPGVLTHTAVVKLAQARLEQIRAALNAKLRRAGAHVTDLDHRVLFLAEQAHTMISTTPPPDDPAAAGAREISKFAVMGSAGPSIPGAGFVLRDGHDWVHDTLHKGTPDENRERVVARSTDFVLAFWRRVTEGIAAAGLTGAAAAAARQAMQAYVLGHLCHIATDVVSDPFIDDLEFHLGLGRQAGFRLAAAGPIDARVAIQVLQRTGPRDGQNWQEWWPPPDAVPAPFYEAFRQAFEDVYGALRIHGSVEFERAFAALSSPPELSADLIRDGYDFYYHGVVGIAYGFDHWKWTLVFLPLVFVVALELIIFPVLSGFAGAFSTAPWALPNTERILFDLFTFPSLIIAPASMIYSIAAAVLTNRGVGGRTVIGIIAAVVSLGGLVAFFATLGTKDADFSPGWRWFLLTVVPLIAPAVFFVLAIVNRGKAVGALDLLYALPFISVLFSVVAYFLFFLPIGFLSTKAGASDPILVVEYVLAALAVFAAVVVAWMALAKYIRNSFMPDMADETFPRRRSLVTVSRLATDRPHMVRLFEDTTLFLDPAVVTGILGAAPAAAQARAQIRKAQFFPSARRKLINLWWEPSGSVFVRSDRFQLVFSDHPDGTGQRHVIPAPVVPSTVAEYVALLNGAAVSAGVAGALKAAAAFPGDLDYELPPGATFADHGDAETTTSAHDEAAAQFVELGHANDDDAYVLFHAPRVAQSIRFGGNGPIPSDEHEDEVVPGEGTVQSDGTEVRGTADTVFSIFFRVGDRIRAATQTRTITLIKSDQLLVVASAFSPALPADTDYVRVGETRERADGYTYVAEPVGVGGETLMDYAGDLAALLCMGAVPHLLTKEQRKVKAVAKTAGGEAIGPVYQVFRNWNLDRRRVNEWRMLIAGHGLSEKQNDSRVYDGALTDPRDGAYTPRQNDDGEATANQLGWVPLLRNWLALAPRAVNPLDTAVAATPNAVSNRALSRGIAFLLDLPEPVAMP